MGKTPTNKYADIAQVLMKGTPQKRNALLEAIMGGSNPLNTLMGDAQGVDQLTAAARAYSQGNSGALLGALPGSGIAGALGYQPEYGNNYFLPSGVSKGPNIKENLNSGDYGQAALQGLGMLGDMGWSAAAASRVPQSAQIGAINTSRPFPDPDTFKGRLEIQGGSLTSKPGIDKIIKTLDDHGMEWKWADNGDGVTAYVEVVDKFGKVSKEGKHFADNSHLKTLRNWLGY